MKKLLFIILLLSSLTLYAQKFDFKVKTATIHAVDLAVLTGVTAYWIAGDNVQPDKVIHFMFGYFATNAMYQLLTISDAPFTIRIGTPILVWTGISFMKEAMFDGSPDWQDFKAGMLGCALSTISFNITYTIRYKSRSASALIINN